MRSKIDEPLECRVVVESMLLIAWQPHHLSAHPLAGGGGTNEGGRKVRSVGSDTTFCGRCNSPSNTDWPMDKCYSAVAICDTKHGRSLNRQELKRKTSRNTAGRAGQWKSCVSRHHGWLCPLLFFVPRPALLVGTSSWPCLPSRVYTNLIFSSLYSEKMSMF